MENVIVFDKIKWHYPDGMDCPSLEHAKVHFVVLMNWLSTNELLSNFGKQVFDIGVGTDFSVTSEMLTHLGSKVLEACYDGWLKEVDYVSRPSTELLDQCLKNQRSNL